MVTQEKLVERAKAHAAFLQAKVAHAMLVLGEVEWLEGCEARAMERTAK